MQNVYIGNLDENPDRFCVPNADIDMSSILFSTWATFDLHKQAGN